MKKNYYSKPFPISHKINFIKQYPCVILINCKNIKSKSFGCLIKKNILNELY
jgi:hypothetical protein